MQSILTTIYYYPHLITFNFLTFCNSEKHFQRIGHFPKLSNLEVTPENFLNETVISEFSTCHRLGKIQLDENYMNANLIEMTKEDKSIIGFRNLNIEY